MNILKINSSVQTDRSITRRLVQRLVEQFKTQDAIIIDRDLRHGVPLLSQEMVNAFYIPEDQRSPAQPQEVIVSDGLLEELYQSDLLIIGAPVYNFGVPGALKAYFDLIARVGKTFRYTKSGPVGLLKDKRAIVVVASGGTPFGSPIDFATGYIKHFLGFIGITDVEFVAADQMSLKGEESLRIANRKIEALASLME